MKNKNKYVEECGYTRANYDPTKNGTYLVKIGYEETDYKTSFWNGKDWDISDSIICWAEIPKTDIEAPF